MKAKESLWRTNEKGGEIRRHKLEELLPLEIPLSIDIEASSICSLKCRYCPQSLDGAKKKSINIGNNGLMDLSVFYSIVDQLKGFKKPLKNIRFAGFGEPLLNKNIVEMITAIKRERVAETVTVFTNGIALSRDMSERIARVVDNFLIDIQGTCAEDYKTWCSTTVDYEGLVDNIRYLYSISGRGKIFCKTFKSIVDGKRDEFFAIFENICDEIGIEDLYEIYPEIDYSNMIMKEKSSDSFEMSYSKYCAYPWYQMAIDADGRVTACTLPISKNSDYLCLGNIKDSNLIEMWDGKKLNEIRYDLLCKREGIEECSGCRYTDLTPQEDRIDHIRDSLIDYCKENMVEEAEQNG